jgi:hypothetical protein
VLLSMLWPYHKYCSLANSNTSPIRTKTYFNDVVQIQGNGDCLWSTEGK